MKLSPVEVANKSFARKLGGYDPDEVIAYLKTVAEEMDLSARERTQLREIIRDKDLQMLEYKERDQALRETITTAHKLTENLRQDAERESKLILHDAQQRAEAIVRDARESLKRTYEEVADLKRQKLRFESELRTLVRSHLDMLDRSTAAANGATSMNMSGGMNLGPSSSASGSSGANSGNSFSTGPGTVASNPSIKDFVLGNLQFTDPANTPSPNSIG